MDEMWHADTEWHDNYGDKVKNETEQMTEWKVKKKLDEKVYIDRTGISL